MQLSEVLVIQWSASPRMKSLLVLDSQTLTDPGLSEAQIHLLPAQRGSGLRSIA